MDGAGWCAGASPPWRTPHLLTAGAARLWPGERLGSRMRRQEAGQQAAPPGAIAISINESKHRYHLMRPETLARIQAAFGMACAVGGKYYPNEAVAAGQREPPLFLSLVPSPRSNVHDAAGAIAFIENVKEGGPLQAAPARLSPALPPAGRGGEAAWERVQLPPGAAAAGRCLRSKILGPGGSFVAYIEAESGAKVSLSDGGEAQQLQVLLSGDAPESVRRARALLDDLFETIDWYGPPAGDGSCRPTLLGIALPPDALPAGACPSSPYAAADGQSAAAGPQRSYNFVPPPPSLLPGRAMQGRR